MNGIYERIHAAGLLPVAAFDSKEQALEACRALARGGMKEVEITLRTPEALDCIAAVREEIPDMLVGAGSVLKKDKAADAVSAGAQFLVTPGFSAEIAQWAKDRDEILFPGCSCASDLMQATAFDLPVVKFFPAQNLGGLPMLRALAAPFPDLSFMPTGGISPANLAEYLSWDRIFACGGSWLLSSQWLKEGNYTEITRAAQAARKLCKEIRP